MRFYGFGFLLGCLVVSVITKGRACRMPSTLKQEELYTQPIEFLNDSSCKLQCRGITENEIKEVLKNGNVDYSRSNVHAKPFARYTVEGSSNNGKLICVLADDCDTITKIISAIEVNNKTDTCKCN